jgi:hypothetical protein
MTPSRPKRERREKRQPSRHDQRNLGGEEATEQLPWFLLPVLVTGSVVFGAGALDDGFIASNDWNGTMSQVLVTLLVAIAIERGSLPTRRSTLDNLLIGFIGLATVAALAVSAGAAAQPDGDQSPKWHAMIVYSDVCALLFLLLVALYGRLMRRSTSA